MAETIVTGIEIEQEIQKVLRALAEAKLEASGAGVMALLAIGSSILIQQGVVIEDIQKIVLELYKSFNAYRREEAEIQAKVDGIVEKIIEEAKEEEEGGDCQSESPEPV